MVYRAKPLPPNLAPLSVITLAILGGFTIQVNPIPQFELAVILPVWPPHLP